MQEDQASFKEKHRTVILLRGMLIVSVGALIIGNGSNAAGIGAVVLIALFAFSDIVLAVLSEARLRSARYDLFVGATDLIVVGLGIGMSGYASRILPVSCMLMVLVVALSTNRQHSIAGATAVSATHAWLLLGQVPGPGAGRYLLLHTIFLCSVGLYYGYLTQQIHHVHRKKDGDELERRELAALVDILGDATSSLDLREVTSTIVNRLTTIVPAARCSILYIDDKAETCHVLVSHDNPDIDMFELDLNKYPEVRCAVQTRKPVILRDMTKDPLMADVKKHLEGLEFHALLVIPLIFGDEVLGTLCLRAALDHEDIGEREIQLCTAVARASANVLKNVLLHRKVQAESNQRLATSEKLERVFNHSPGLMFVTDADDRITDFNRGAEELLGYSRNEILGQSSAVLTCTEDEEHRRRFTRKDGSELIADFKRIQLLDESGDPTGTLWAGRDLTDLKATQLQLIQAEKLATIGEVISGVAHELNNPLTGVLGYSQLLMARNRDSQTGRELDKISQAAQRCQKIVKNLLSFARADKPNRRLLGINGIIEKTLDLKKYQLHVNNIQVVKNLDPDLPCTTLDFHQIQQVFLNLINNAQHAIAGAGMNPGRIEVTTSHDGDTIQVRMSDNGHGMSPKTLERIFEPFFSTKRDGEGTGLGLSVSYGIVKEHGGTILASSREEEGTTFVLEFPIMAEKDAGAATEQAPSAHVPQAAQPGRILVVDDEPIILDLMIDILAELGHKIDTAENGMEASRKIKNGCYDLVITDVRMPQMDGIELYREIVASRPDLEQKVVFITGDLINTRTVEFLAEIGAPTVPKPLEIGKVTELVEKLLHPSAGSAGGA